MRTILYIFSLYFIVISCIPIQPRGNTGAPTDHKEKTSSLKKELTSQDYQKGLKKTKSNIYTTHKNIIKYKGYNVFYNEQYLIPNWVSYELTSSETDGPYARNDKKFRKDALINLPQADDKDYKNSGWSKGHMAPSGDFKWNDKAMWETFYYTNCCPQNAKLNNGQWKTLEKKVRNWATKYGKINVVTGPLVFDNQYGTIGKNKVVVPDAFFKAVLAGEQCIAFVMYNRAENENMQKCAMSVDKLEELSGIDFFYKLEDEIENKIEATYSLKYWNL